MLREYRAFNERAEDKKCPDSQEVRPHYIVLFEGDDGRKYRSKGMVCQNCMRVEEWEEEVEAGNPIGVRPMKIRIWNPITVELYAQGITVSSMLNNQEYGEKRFEHTLHNTGIAFNRDLQKMPFTNAKLGKFEFYTSRSAAINGYILAGTVTNGGTSDFLAGISAPNKEHVTSQTPLVCFARLKIGGEIDDIVKFGLHEEHKMPYDEFFVLSAQGIIRHIAPQILES